MQEQTQLRNWLSYLQLLTLNTVTHCIITLYFKKIPGQRICILASPAISWVGYTALHQLHHLRSPSCPKEALTVGKARAAVTDFAVSDGTPLIVMSSTTCGRVSALIAASYTLHTATPNIKLEHCINWRVYTVLDEKKTDDVDNAEVANLICCQMLFRSFSGEAKENQDTIP